VEAINALLPGGLEILDATPLLPGAPSLGKLADAARYRVASLPERPWPHDPGALPPEIRSAVNRWKRDGDGTLRLELALRSPTGSAPSLKKVLMALGVAEEELPSVRIVRESVLLRRPKSGAPSRSEG